MKNKKQKVGIVTLPGNFNYGNRLQNYAVAQAYESRGFKAESLVLTDRPNALRDLKQLVRKLLRKPVSHPEDNMSEERLEAFQRFNKNMCTGVVNFDEFNPKEYAFFSVGSDQVWNLGYIKYNEDWFFLDFAKKEQRIALAPSIGLDALDERQSRRLAKGVRNFPLLSVREERGAELIYEASGIRAEVICDPTLVLTPEEWDAVSSDSLTPKEPYIFTYLLGGVGSEASDVLKQLHSLNGYPVISLTDRDDGSELPAGPAEFISLIKNATFVVTDSFHAAVFSSIFETPLSIVHRDGMSMFSRLQTLAEKLGTENKIYNGGTLSLETASDYAGVAERIAGERERFNVYLSLALNQKSSNDSRHEAVNG